MPSKKRLAIKSDSYELREFSERIEKATMSMFAARDRLRAILAEHQELIDRVGNEELKLKRAVNTIGGCIIRMSEAMETDEEQSDGKAEEES